MRDRVTPLSVRGVWSEITIGVAGGGKIWPCLWWVLRLLMLKGTV